MIKKNKKKIMIYTLVTLFLLIFSGCSVIEKFTDECKSNFEECKYSCGEGLLSNICQSKCTYDYNQCKEENK
ncbi:MAG: hypothetical protein PF569_08930 [Candidatus Woesearchaeota archaeon]|jgi:hypothetical protein|nr:hypothetical protein [Candidatus Woesearchaeota archaeon]